MNKITRRSFVQLVSTAIPVSYMFRGGKASLPEEPKDMNPKLNVSADEDAQALELMAKTGHIEIFVGDTPYYLPIFE